MPSENNGFKECKYVDGFFVENADLLKNEDGQLVRISTDGKEEIFKNISNDKEMPVQVEFNITIGERE